MADSKNELTEIKKRTSTGRDDDPFYGKGPHIQRYNVPTQAEQERNDLEKSMFPEIGQGLEGMKDSPLDKNR